MPSDEMPEEASLLGGDGPEELRNITLSVSSVRALTADGSLGTSQQVETDYGQVTVAVAGDPSKPAILTFHDLGLNHVTNFQSFFHYPDMRAMLHSFRLVSVNAPGQEEGAAPLPDGYVYPTMEQLAGTVERVRSHLGLRSFIGLGVGMGANVLARYSVLHPMHIDALVLVNCSASAAGWVEWGYQKLNIRHLKAGSITTATVDYLLWHHFGKVDQCSQDLVTVFRKHFEHNLNATNLGLLIDAYIRRTDLGIVRELDPHKKKEARMLRCPVLNITSNYSPHIEDTVSFNGRLDPANSNWMKVQDCGMVLEEQPGKVVEAFRLFLQGQGYVVGSSRRASSVAASHVEALHRGRLTSNSRQNSLPLIRGVPPRPKTGILLATAEEGDVGATDQDASPHKEGGKTQDDMAVGVLSSAVANGNEKDIRITENPLEHPAV